MNIIKNLAKKTFRIVGVLSMYSLFIPILPAAFVFFAWYWSTLWLIGWLSGMSDIELTKSMLILIPLLGSMIFGGWFLVIFCGVYESMPEVVAEKAREFSKENPEYGRRIEEFIQEAFTQDETGVLQEAIKKFKALANDKKYLANSPKRVEETRVKIAALEKELGL
jgi:hypothetical protein